MNPPQHPGSEVHENAGGAAPPAVEKEECKLGNVEIELDEIQGNIFGGFNKDHQVFVFFRIDDAKKAKRTLGPVNEKADDFPSGIFNHVRHSASDAVLGFNEQFRALRRAGLPEGSIKATWTNLVLTATGMTKLGQSIDDLPAETRMDSGPDQVGHEQFGFKDGVSQPGVRGVDAPTDPLHNPDQGDPGQDLLHPGEFVFGYPTQIPEAPDFDHDGPNPCQGPDSGEGIDWLKNGSLLVFRRLAQAVAGFRHAVAKNAAQLGITTDLLGAKLVGRYASGAPLEALKFQAGIGEYEPPMADPGVADPALANSDALNNDFEYGEDEDGVIVPLSAHVRKAYPRDQEPEFEGRDAEGHPIPRGPFVPNEAESKTQTHRLLRRGIPFGKSFGAAIGGGAEEPRGLLFLAYQTDIERQFEFVQRTWVDDPDFPKKRAGQDPIITNNTTSGKIAGCPFHPRADASKCPIDFKHFVKTRGGAYFFVPSISTLREWLT